MDHKLTREEINAIKKGRSYLIDVRSDAELAEFNCKYAKHWDVQEMIEGRMPDISKESPVFLFCRSGNRSAVAQRSMAAAGFVDAHDLGGLETLPDELCR